MHTLEARDLSVRAPHPLRTFKRAHPDLGFRQQLIGLIASAQYGQEYPPNSPAAPQVFHLVYTADMKEFLAASPGSDSPENLLKRWDKTLQAHKDTNEWVLSDMYYAAWRRFKELRSVRVGSPEAQRLVEPVALTSVCMEGQAIRAHEAWFPLMVSAEKQQDPDLMAQAHFVLMDAWRVTASTVLHFLQGGEPTAEMRDQFTAHLDDWEGRLEKEMYRVASNEKGFPHFRV